MWATKIYTHTEQAKLYSSVATVHNDKGAE